VRQIGIVVGGDRGADHAPDVALDVDPRAGQAEIDHDLAQRRTQSPCVRHRAAGVVAAIGRRLRIHVFGGHTRAHEDEAVFEIVAPQNLDANRIEECLSALRLPMFGEQRDEVLLDRLPQRVAFPVGQRDKVEVAFDALGGFAHALVVEVDPLARAPAHAVPVAVFEAALGQLRDIAEQAVVAVEAFDDRARDMRRVAASSDRSAHRRPARESRAHSSWADFCMRGAPVRARLTT